MTVGPIWNTGGTETEIIVPVSVLGPQRALTEMGGDHRYMLDRLHVKATICPLDAMSLKSVPGRHCV